MRVRRLINDDFDNAWHEVHLLLTPTTLSTAPKYKDFINKTNRDQCALNDYNTQPANMAGNALNNFGPLPLNNYIIL